MTAAVHLFGVELDSHVNSFGASLNTTCTYSETCLIPTYTSSKTVSRATSNAHSLNAAIWMKCKERACGMDRSILGRT